MLMARLMGVPIAFIKNMLRASVNRKFWKKNLYHFYGKNKKLLKKSTTFLLSYKIFLIFYKQLSLGYLLTFSNVDIVQSKIT